MLLLSQGRGRNNHLFSPVICRVSEWLSVWESKTCCSKAIVYIATTGRRFGLKKITLNTSQYTHHKVRSDLSSAEKKAILLQK